MSNKDSYLQMKKSQLEELRTGIDKLAGKTHLAEVKAMTACQREARALQSQLQKVFIMLDEIKATGETGWSYLKAEMEGAFETLSRSLRDLKARS